MLLGKRKPKIAELIVVIKIISAELVSVSMKYDHFIAMAIPSTKPPIA